MRTYKEIKKISDDLLSIISLAKLRNIGLRTCIHK